jgi:agmatine deiminase
MITGKEMNVVCLSRIIRQNARFSEICSRLSEILERNQIEIKFLDSTKDIWCRDYMPVQVEKERFIQLRYQPSYLQDALELQSEPRVINKANGIRAEFSNINLDGGNLVSWMDRAIVTDRVFHENPEYRNKKDLIAELENLLEVEVIVIPQIRKDMTGHADGLVRFLDRTTLIGNDRKKEYSYWKNGMANFRGEKSDFAACFRNE